MGEIYTSRKHLLVFILFLFEVAKFERSEIKRQANAFRM